MNENNMDDQSEDYAHYDDHDDVQFADQFEEHKIVPRDDHDVHSLILPPNRCTKRCLNTCDVFLSLFVISPLTIVHWRGTWAIMDSNMDYFPPMNCFIFGMVFHLVIAMIREFLYAEYKKTKSQKRTWTRVMCRSILTKLYAYLFSWACQMHWRGGWAVIDHHFGNFDWNKIYFFSNVSLLHLPRCRVDASTNRDGILFVFLTMLQELTECRGSVIIRLKLFS